MKKFHFLAGFPRTGNGVLSSILNQNPDIYSSPLSAVSEYLYLLNKTYTTHENTKRVESNDGSINIIKNLLVNNYSHIDKPIIIDREKNWGSTVNLNLIKEYLDPQPKIIFTVRPIVDILASSIKILSDFSYIDMAMMQQDWWYKDYLTVNDNRCDFIMRPWGEMDMIMYSLNEIIKPENKGIFHLVEYDDLINNPNKTLSDIYEFLEIDNYKHDFSNIKKLEKDNDEILGLPKDIHKVRSVLSKTSTPAKELLSDYAIQKYSNLEFWRQK
jgi:sulfotransferase